MVEKGVKEGGGVEEFLFLNPVKLLSVYTFFFKTKIVLLEVN